MAISLYPNNEPGKFNNKRWTLSIKPQLAIYNKYEQMLVYILSSVGYSIYSSFLLGFPGPVVDERISSHAFFVPNH